MMAMSSELLTFLELLALFVVVWVAIVFMWRSVCSTRSNAASCVSLVYCASTVVWTGLILYGEAKKFPVHRPFDFQVSQQSRNYIQAFLAYTIAYFSTDMIFDYDPRFVTHHLLSILAVVTTLLYPNLEGTFLMTALIAEIGGVMYHVSKLMQKDLMTIIFLYTYSFTRLVLFPPFIVWLVYGMWFNDEHRTVPNVWATLGTAVLVSINIRWSFIQWSRLYPQAKAPVDAPATPHKSPSHRHGRNVTVLISPTSPLAGKKNNGVYYSFRSLFSGMAAIAWDVVT